MEDISRVQGILKISQVTLVFLVMPIGIELLSSGGTLK